VIINGIKRHVTATETFYRFTIEANAGGGVLRSMGWRYYPDSRRLRPPARPTTQGWSSFAGSDDACRNSIRRLVELQIEARELDEGHSTQSKKEAN